MSSKPWAGVKARIQSFGAAFSTTERATVEGRLLALDPDRWPSYLEGTDEEIVARLRSLLPTGQAALRLGAAIVPISYSQYRAQWQTQTTTLDKGLYHRDEEYMQVWNVKKAEWLRALEGQLKARRCYTEKGEGFTAVYEDGAKCIKLIMEVVAGPGAAATSKYFINKQATVVHDGTERRTRPDPTWCHITIPGVDPMPKEQYKFATLVKEYKKKDDMEAVDGNNNVNIGLGQVIGRAGECFLARQLASRDSFVLPAAVTDNFYTVNSLIQTGLWADLQRVLQTPRLKLVSEPAQVNPDYQYTWDVNMEGTQDIIYACWKASREPVMRAAAEPKDVCLRDGCSVAVLCDDGRREEFRIVSRLAPPTPSGCAYVAQLCSPGMEAAGQQRVVLKVGPPQHLASRARDLGLRMDMWTQVEQEAHILSSLGPGSHPSLPVLLCYGTLEASSAATESSSSTGGSGLMTGAPVVVTQLHGLPLATPGATQQLRLPVSDVEQLMWDSFEALAHLQAQGVSINDIHVRNIGRRPPSAAGQPGGFYFYDMGCATTPADRNARSRIPPLSLEFSPAERLLGCYPGELGDAQSLIYVASPLLGYPLPWADAANQERLDLCYDLRVAAMRNPLTHLPFLRLLSAQLQSLCVDILTSSLGQGHEATLSQKLAAARAGRE